MKTSLLTAVAAALVCGFTAVSCASTGGKTSSSASSTSISSSGDMFAGRTFASKGQKLEFGKDRTLVSYAFVQDRNEWVKEQKSSYTFNAKNKTFSSKTISFNVGGKEFSNADDVVKEFYPQVESQFKEQAKKISIDKTSQNNFLAISKQQIKDLYSVSFKNSDDFTYEFSNDGKSLKLKQVINRDLSYAAMSQYRGQDESGKYQLVISNYLMNLAIMDPKTGKINEGDTFQGNCVIDDKAKTFSTELYRITVKLDSKGQPISQSVAKAGKLSATYELVGFTPNEEAQKQGFDVYNGTFVLTVKQAPKGLEAVKTLYIPCAFQSASAEYNLQ